jgi:glycosyltransferase involved in cell wall biosynthesis
VLKDIILNKKLKGYCDFFIFLLWIKRGKKMKYINIFMLLIIILITHRSILCITIDAHERRLVVISAGRNNAEWYEKNVDSIVSQKYDNYIWIYIDDASTDGTAGRVLERVKQQGKEDKLILIANTEHYGALANIYNAIHRYTSGMDIVLLVDGDDWLYHDQVFAVINKTYENPEVWMTYGQMIEFPPGLTDYCQPVPDDVTNNNSYREYTWATSHLRTFYAWLFKLIKKEDLLDQNAKFFPMTWDQAIMFPMLEMARKHAQFISEVLYVYNKKTAFNDNKVDPELQKMCEQRIRCGRKYDKCEAPVIE